MKVGRFATQFEYSIIALALMSVCLSRALAQDGHTPMLKPDGEFHMLDFEGREDGEHSFLARLLHSGHRLKDNSESRVLAFMTQAGFADPKKVGRRAMLFGCIAYYRARV